MMTSTDHTRRAMLGAIAAGMILPSTARAQPARGIRKQLRIGIMADLSGPYADLSLPGEACARQAIADSGAAARGWDVDVLVVDHQNKADLAVSTARRWFDQENVDALVDVSTSATALAVNGIVRERNKVMLVSQAGTSELTGKACSPNTIHWVWDTAMLARSLGTAVVREGGESWFFLGADYAFGHQLVTDATGVVQALGSRVLDAVYHPFPGTTDFSSFLLRAQASGAKVLAMCNSGTDLINCIKQSQEFGVGQQMRVVGMLCYDTTIHALGLEAAQGLQMAAPYYWDLNDRTRAFQARVQPKTPNLYPNMGTAGIYSSTLHYLKAAADMGIDQVGLDGAATVARMKAMPTDDDCFGPGRIREDGRKLHPVHILQAKAPGESQHGWDLLKVIATLPPEEAFRPIGGVGCKLSST